MNNKLKYYFDLLEKDKQDLLSQIAALPHLKWVEASENERWSISQILAHLLTAELASLNYMKKKFLGVNKLKNSGWVESLKILFLKISQRFPFKYKAPAYVIANTPKALSFNEVKEQWNTIRVDLKIFLEGIEEKNIRKKIYKHPFAGYLDAVQATIFLREHFHHHMPQIKRQLGK